MQWHNDQTTDIVTFRTSQTKNGCMILSSCCRHKVQCQFQFQLFVLLTKALRGPTTASNKQNTMLQFTQCFPLCLMMVTTVGSSSCNSSFCCVSCCLPAPFSHQLKNVTSLTCGVNHNSDVLKRCNANSSSTNMVKLEKKLAKQLFTVMCQSCPSSQ